MKPPMLKSVNDFDKSLVKFTEYHQWHYLAYILWGYAILKEMGLTELEDQNRWKKEKHDRWQKNNQWNLTVVELLVILFFEHRHMKFVIGGERYEIINSVLIELAQLTDNHYVTKEKTRINILKKNYNEAEPVFKAIGKKSVKYWEEKSEDADDDT